MLSDLKQSIDHLFLSRRLWCSTTSPQSIHLLAAYTTGGLHATTEIATGGPTPDWHINDISFDASTLLAYIRVEQLKLARSMGGDVHKFSVTARRSAAGFSGPLTPEEDPELFDESTGPTGGAR
jgi:hypothetical protein